MNELKKTEVREHGITITNRSKTAVSGVTDVVRFDDDRVDLKTNMGRLIIKGRGLNVNKLNTDSGELDITGEIQSLEYVNKRDKEGIFTGLFR